MPRRPADRRADAGAGRCVVVGIPGAKDPAVEPLEGPFSSDVRTGLIAAYWDGSTTPTAILRPPPSGIEGVVLANFGEHVEVSGNTVATTALAVGVGGYYSPTIAVYLLVYQRSRRLAAAIPDRDRPEPRLPGTGGRPAGTGQLHRLLRRGQQGGGRAPPARRRRGRSPRSPP